MKRNKVPSKKKREMSYNSNINKTNVDFDNLVKTLNNEQNKNEWQFTSP